MMESHAASEQHDWDGHQWYWAWNGRADAANGLTEQQAARGSGVGDELFRRCMDVGGRGFERVVFFGRRERRWTIRTGDELYREGGQELMRYAAFDLAVKLMESGRYDLLCDVRELAWCWSLSF